MFIYKDFLLRLGVRIDVCMHRICHVRFCEGFRTVLELVLYWYGLFFFQSYYQMKDNVLKTDGTIKSSANSPA